MANEHRDRIAPLSNLSDFEVADHDPDVRGWDVIAADGRKVGEVEDLIVDTSAMKVRYLDIEVDKDYRVDNDNRRILVPVGQARLHDNEDHVHVSSLSSTDVRGYPAHSGRFDRTYEDRVSRHFGSVGGASSTTGTTGGSERDFYSHSHFDDRNFYGARRGSTARDASDTGRSGMSAGSRSGSGKDHRMTLSEEELAVGKQRREAGEVRVGKHVETEHVSRDVPVKKERASVERRPITDSDSRSARATITEDEVRVPLMKEEAVVEKRVRPKEELVVRKHTEQETEHIETDLRKERADIDRAGSRSSGSTRGSDRNRGRR